ncbi:MAG TPA: hypothetical protein VFP82_02760, partial [Chthoniobacterales bacterium]|nr:hypothetical protein [Chthoniobacterales bacterium]
MFLNCREAAAFVSFVVEEKSDCGRHPPSQKSYGVTGGRLYICRMKKSFLVSILTFAIAFGLNAQTGPDKSPSIGKAKAAAKKTETSPPPIQSGSTKGDATANAKNENAKPIDQSNFDTSVKPSDDFFLYANGGWIKRTEIPPDQTR